MSHVYMSVYMFTYIQTYTHKYIYTCTHIYIYICIYIHRVTCHIQQHMYVCVCVYSVVYCRQHTHPSLVVNCLQTATVCHNDHVYARHASVKHGVVTYQSSIDWMYMQSNIFPYIFDSNLIL